MTFVGTHMWDMGWGRRIVLFALGTIGFLLLGIAVSAALARPAGAATLPGPGPSSLTAPVTALPSDLISGVTGAAGGIAPLPPLPTLPTAPLPTLPGAPLPTVPITALSVPSLPVPSLPGLPVITAPGTGILTAGTPTAGGAPAAGTGPVPGIGGAARGSAAGHRGPSSSGRSGTGGSRSSNRSDTPTRAPAHRVPAPSFPTVTGIAGDATTPGHGNTPWNVVPLTILLLSALGLGGVFLRRRLAFKPLFDSRLAPPG